MLFVWRVLESMGMRDKLPIVVEVDNRGAVDLVNSSTTTGRTRHIAIWINFLRELLGPMDFQCIHVVGYFYEERRRQRFCKQRDVYVREDPSVPVTINPFGEDVGVRLPDMEVPRDADVVEGTGSTID